MLTVNNNGAICLRSPHNESSDKHSLSEVGLAEKIEEGELSVSGLVGLVLRRDLVELFASK